MASSVDALVASGFTEATLWVLDNNSRARSFYEASGWTIDEGGKQEMIGGMTVCEVRYWRALT